MTNGVSTEPRGEWRPSKALWFWSCAGCVAATIIIGFAWGGWVTSGTANEMASDAASEARAQLVANVCVEKFTSSPEFPANLAALKKANSWNRDEVITKGGWVTLAGMNKPFADAADACAEKLMTMQAPATATTSTASNS